MHAIESKSRRVELLSFLVLFAGVLAAAVTLVTIVRTHVPLFSGDYEQVFFRAAQLKHGEISVADFVFRRQVDHPHFIVFGLAYLDLTFFGGRAWLLYAASFAFCIAMVVTVAMTVRRSGLDRSASLVVSGLSAFLLFGPQNMGILSWPFQVTLIGTASLVLTASYLLAYDHQPRGAITACLLLGIAVVSHGAGVLIIPVLVVFALVTRSKRYGIVAGLLAVEFVIYAAHYPTTPHIRLSAIMAKMIHAPSEWIGIPAYVAYLLGHGITFGLLGSVVDVLIGAVGLCAYFASVVRFLLFKKGSSHLLFISTFGLLACLTSITLNIAYEDLRKATVNLSYFFADRYLPWTAFFWIGTFTNTISVLYAVRGGRISPPMIGAMATVFLVIASVPFIQKTDSVFLSRIAVMQNFGCLDKVSACVLSRAVGLPVDSARPWSALVFGWQTEVGALNVPRPQSCSGGAQTLFARDSMLDRGKFVQATNFSDVNWNRGISRSRAGFFVKDAELLTDLSPCDIARFADGSVRGITAIDGRNVYVEGSALPDAVGYPALIQILRHWR
ncbi:hypothetical protein [Paraburkholderia strydomiana]|uniref:hypothetical protein n=1 Tax=Paraburkholderia strydomiana TaxID=1245417 RepID=UPI001BE50A23|nr:hypothetical protein [Paraburkholderia strydomiana]MBT2791204.1 hypothetical protein [Paraburkholderia strydomiana]